MPAFRGTPQDQMAAILSSLAKAREESSYESFDLALASLPGLDDRQAVHGAVDAGALAQFRRELADSVAGFADELAGYATQTLLDAEIAEPDDWRELALRRSAIQLLVDGYAGAEVAALVPARAVAELDEELRRVAPGKVPVHESDIPRGLPDGHWWWQLPNPPMGTPMELMAATLSYLARAADDYDDDADAYRYLAMMALVDLRVRESEDDAIDPAAVADFRRAAGAAIARLGGGVAEFARLAREELHVARDEDWYRVCTRRSALQLLLDDFPGSGVAELLLDDPDHNVEKLDVELRRMVADRARHLTRPARRGLPDSHWWWRSGEP